MRNPFAAVSVSVLFAGAALAFAADGLRASKPEVRREIIATIGGQLAAFRVRDVRGAYAFAATAFRAQKSQDDFSALVRAGYPEIWSNTGAEFGIVRDDGRLATVTVQVRSPAGSAAYDYALLRESAGWRIAGAVRRASAKPKA
jgi:hypothetical protein